MLERIIVLIVVVAMILLHHTVAYAYSFKTISSIILIGSRKRATISALGSHSRYSRALLHLSSSTSTHANTVKDKSPFFITTPIYYVNGLPHLGHAYTSVASDIIARFHRCDDREVYFLTGTDEHGQKVEQSAIANNTTPIEFANNVSEKFHKLLNILNCSNDDFIRTTETRHKAAVSALWKQLEDNNQIYLGAYEGWYSIRDEAFYAEGELINGKAPTGADVEWVKEESYFFRLSEWTQKLLDFYNENPDFIGPKSRRNEVVSFVNQEGGLKDLSVSRTTFSWGIPVPGNPKHVVYVWLDALANYITAIDYPNMNNPSFVKYWPASLHVVGKDILRFHCIFWPAFLMAAGLKPPKRIFAHGWWTKNGEKMSKSIGNVLNPYELVDAYGTDNLRYFLIAEVPFGNDGDFSHESFCNRVNSDLANDVGNLAQRVLTFIQKNCDGRVPEYSALNADDAALLAASSGALQKMREHMSTQNLKGVCETIISVSKLGNKYIDTQAPWNLKKSDVPRMHTTLYVLIETIRHLAVMLAPITPAASGNLLDQIGVDASMRTFASIEDGSRISVGTAIGVPSPVFPKVEPSAAMIAAAGINMGAAATTATATATTTVSTKPPPAAGTVRAAVDFEDIGQGMTLDELQLKIVEVGDKIRDLKASGAAKEVVKPHVQELLAYKERYKILNMGIGYSWP